MGIITWLSTNWNLGPSMARLDLLDRERIASKLTVFLDKSISDNSECGVIVSSFRIRMSASQISVYLGTGGRTLKQPRVTLFIREFEPSTPPDIPE